MKKRLTVILATSLLFQGCYSYRNFDLKSQEIVEEKLYKIAKNEQYQKVRIMSIADSVVTYKIGKYENQIHLRDIHKMKSKELSILRTTATVVLTLVVAFLYGAGQAMKDFKYTSSK